MKGPRHNTLRRDVKAMKTETLESSDATEFIDSPASLKFGLTAMLRSRNICPTSQRLTIAGQLFACYQHLTANELHRILVRKGSDIARATVYNTLNLFVEKGLLREILVNGEETYYDTNPTRHHHIYNLDTGELSDLPGSEAIDLSGLQLPPGLLLDRVEVVVRVRQAV